MIVKCAAYEDGRRREGDLPLEEAGSAANGDGGSDGDFVWLGVVEPAAEEFDSIAREFHLHELAVEDAIHAHQRPKVEVYGDTLFVVVKTVHYVDSEEVVNVGELLLFVHRTFVITVRHGHGPLAEVRERLERRSDLLSAGPRAGLYPILVRVVDDYEAAAHEMDSDVQEVERQVFSTDG